MVGIYKKRGLIDLLDFAAGKFLVPACRIRPGIRVKDINSHDDGVDVVEYERDPIGAGLATAAAVDASPHELSDDGDGHGQEDEAEHCDAPRIVVVQDQLNSS